MGKNGCTLRTQNSPKPHNIQKIFNTSKFTAFIAHTQHTLMDMNEDGKGAHTYM